MLLIDNVELVSGVQQSDSVIHVHARFFFKFFPHLGYSSVLGRVVLDSKTLLIFFFLSCAALLVES